MDGAGAPPLTRGVIWFELMAEADATSGFQLETEVRELETFFAFPSMCSRRSSNWS